MRGHLRQRGQDGIYYAVLHTAEKNPKTGKDIIIQRSLGTTSKRDAEVELAKLIA